MAIVVAQLASPYVAQFFAGQTTVGSIFIKANPTPFIIQTVIFLGVIVLLTTRANITGAKGKGVLSPFELAAYSILNSGIILSTILTYLDDGTRATILSQSHLVTMINQYHDLWLMIPIILMIVMGFHKSSRSSD